jgi:hypothetical protein
MMVDSRKGLDQTGLFESYLMSRNEFDARTEVR